MLYLGGGYRLNMNTQSGIAHGFVQQGQTVSGTISTYIINASSTLVNAAITEGSAIKISAFNDLYTVASVVGTVITTIEPLARTYPAGTHLFVDTVSAWAGVEGFGSLATQATDANKPAYVANFIDAFPAIHFRAGTKALPLANYSQSDNILSAGGTLIAVLGINSAGGASAGRFIQKTNNTGIIAWLLSTGAGLPGFVNLAFSQVTTGVTGVFTTDSVIPTGETQILVMRYNALIPTTPPVIRLLGQELNVNITTVSTGTAITNVGGTYTIGNRVGGDRGFDGYILEWYLIKHVLTDYDSQKVEDYLADKYNLTLYDNPFKTYGARSYIMRKPSAPGTYKLLVCLTGGGGTGTTFEEQLGINDILGETTIRIYLDPTKNGAGGLTWNSGGAQTYNRAPDNIYIPDLIAFVKAQLALQGYIIDETYLIGHSNGGMMSYRLMVENPYMFAGAVVMAGDVQVANPGTYVGRILHFHGLLDENVPLYGGIGLGGVFFTPVEPTVDKFIYAYKDFEVLLTAGHSVSTIKAAIISEQDTTLQQRIADFVLA